VIPGSAYPAGQPSQPKARQSGNLAIWQSGNLAIWQSGNPNPAIQQSSSNPEILGGNKNFLVFFGEIP
jgi:hypothetical protein